MLRRLPRDQLSVGETAGKLERGVRRCWEVREGAGGAHLSIQARREPPEKSHFYDSSLAALGSL